MRGGERAKVAGEAVVVLLTNDRTSETEKLGPFDYVNVARDRLWVGIGLHAAEVLEGAWQLPDGRRFDNLMVFPFEGDR